MAEDGGQMKDCACCAQAPDGGWVKSLSVILFFSQDGFLVVVSDDLSSKMQSLKSYFSKEPEKK